MIMRRQQVIFCLITGWVLNGLFVNAQAVAQSDLSEIVRQQSAQINELRTELEELKDLTPTEASSDSGQGLDIDIHGFVSQGFMKTSHNNYLTEDSEDGSFQFNEIGINFSTQLSNKLRVGMQLFSRDLGDVGNNEIILDWAYADYRWRDWLGFRAGRVKMPFGLYNETRDFDMLRTSILLPQGVYDENLRDTLSATNGVALYGEIPLDTWGGLSYQALYGYMNGSDDDGVAYRIEDGTAFNVTDSETKLVSIAQLEWQTPIDGLRLGLTGGFSDRFVADMETTSDFASGSDIPVWTKGDDIETVVLSGEYVVGHWTFNTEWFRRKLDTVVTADNFPVGGGVTVDGVILSQRPSEQKGHYFGAAYRFNDWFELGSYYSVAIPNIGDSKTEDWALSARFDLSENWIFKLEGHYMDGTSVLMSDPNPGTPEDDWFMLLAKVTYSF